MLLIGSNQGFTLIELLLVIVLIGVIVGLTLPNFIVLLESIEFKTTSRQVLNLFNKLSLQSIIDGQKQVVNIQGNNLVYQTKAGEKVTFGRGIREIKLKDGTTPIYFYPTGRSSGAKLLLVTNNGYQTTIVIDEITAKAAVEDKK